MDYGSTLEFMVKLNVGNDQEMENLKEIPTSKTEAEINNRVRILIRKHIKSRASSCFPLAVTQLPKLNKTDANVPKVQTAQKSTSKQKTNKTLRFCIGSQHLVTRGIH